MRPPQSSRRPTAVEVFAGAGGMSLGWEQAGFDVLVAYDHDPVHVCTHRYNFPDVLAVCADVAELTGAAIRRDLARAPLLRGRDASDLDLDCVFGGPSCQGFSEIGRMDRTDARNGLVFEFARVVAELRPRYFVMENVPGFASPRYASVVADLTALFETAGYSLLGAGPLRLEASGFGVPQVRKRVFLVGARADQLMPASPVGTVRPVPVADAIADLPNADDFATLLSDDVVATTRLGTAAAGSFGYAMREDSGHLGRPRDWDRGLLTSSRRTVHAVEIVRRLRDLAPGEVEQIGRLRRLIATKPSVTLRAGTGRDHGSFTASRPVHYRYPRVITVREAARIQSFPDWFRFHTTKWHGFRQVGNAVPPLLARAVAQSIVDALGLAPDKPHDPSSLGNPEDLTLTMLEAAAAVGRDARLVPPDVRRSGTAA